MAYFCTNHDKILSRSFLFLATKLQIFILCSNDSRQVIDGWVMCQILHVPNWQVVVKSHQPTEILTCTGRLAGASVSACLSECKIISANSNLSQHISKINEQTCYSV